MTFEEFVEEGREGEAAVMAACVEMGYAPITCTYKDDVETLVDVKYARLLNDRVEFFCPDVKSIGAFVLPEQAFTRKKWGFGVEWVSGPEKRATSLSACNASVSHLVYTPKYMTGRRPFYLLNIEDVRAFYLAHRDDEEIVKLAPGEGNRKMRLLDPKAFSNEYGFDYYDYNDMSHDWICYHFGRQVYPHGVYPLESNTHNWASCNEALKYTVKDTNRIARRILGDWEHVEELYDTFKKEDAELFNIINACCNNTHHDKLVLDRRFIPKSEEKWMSENE